MARDYVKLHTCILRDPDINDLSAEHGWNWARMLALAGDVEDRGRIGDVRTVAYVLRVDEDSIRATVDALSGRIIERDGELHFRDWHEWQTASNKERQRSHRESGGNDVSQPVTERNDVSQAVTGCNEITDTRPRRPKRQDQQDQDTQRAAPDGAADWTPFYDDCGALWDCSPYRQDGAPYAWVGQLAALFGKAVGTDVSVARRVLVQWSKADEFRYALNPALAPKKAGKWLREWQQYEGVVQS